MVKTNQPYADIVADICERVRRETRHGTVANYIPSLARVPRSKLGIALATVDGDIVTAGDADEPFSIQSVSKVFTLALALERHGSRLWRRVGLEPSGNPFNSLVQLEYENGLPRNPFINAGAIVVTDALTTVEADAKGVIRDTMRALSGNPAVDFDDEVAASEAAHGHRNAALAHFLKSHGNLNSDVETVLDTYFHQCALAMSCIDLAKAALPLANRGVHPLSGERVMPMRRSKRINALMMTCGLYDAVGSFAFRVGMPAKSGVGGGIIGVIPGNFAVCVWSPALDRSGNSCAGSKALELLTTKTGNSVF